MKLIKQTLGEVKTNEKWTPLSSLPGAQVDILKKIGSDIFTMYSDIKLNEVFVMSTFFNHSLTYREEMNCNLLFIKKLGKLLKTERIDFDAPLEGYSANTFLYQLQDEYYLAVQDEMGEYLYKWRKTSRRINHNAQEKLTE